MFDDKCLNLVEIAGKSQIQEIEALYNEAPPSGSSEHNTKIALDEVKYCFFPGVVTEITQELMFWFG